MLLVICDDAVAPPERTWCRDALCAGIEASAGPVELATDAADSTLRGESGEPRVVWLRGSVGRSAIEAAAAAASEIVLLLAVDLGHRARAGTSAGDATGVQTWQYVAALGAPRVAVWLSAPDGSRADPTGELSAALGAHRVVRVQRTGSRRGRRQMYRLGRLLVTAACAPQRLDRSGSVVRRQQAASAATDVLEDLLCETDVEEFQIRGGESMIVQYSGGRVERRPSPFAGDDHLIEAVRFMAAYSGDRPQRFDELDPRLDVRVGERWRLHAEAFVTSPPNVVLRSNLAGRMQLDDLGVVSPELGKVLIEAIAGRSRANVVVAAAMGGGKTTLCQALLAVVPDHERIDTIEDTPELRLHDYGIHPNTYERLTRDPNQDGHGRHSMADHIRDAKRANASKLVVGEIRGDGCEALLDAMSSGIDGCLVTLHSQAGKGVLEKLVAYACSEGAEPDYARRQIAAAVDLCVWMGRNDEGHRVVADVTQLTGIDDVTGVISTTCLWALRPGELWAAPVGTPVGRIAQIYLAAGLAMSQESGSGLPARYSGIVDVPVGNAGSTPGALDTPAPRTAAPQAQPAPAASLAQPTSLAQPIPSSPSARTTPSAEPIPSVPSAPSPGAVRSDQSTPSADSFESAPAPRPAAPAATTPLLFDASDDSVSGEVVWDPGPLVPVDDVPPYEALVAESARSDGVRPDLGFRTASGHTESGHTESGHTESGHAESGHAESGYAGRGRVAMANRRPPSDDEPTGALPC